MAVEVAQRQPGEFQVHRLPQPVDGPLHHSGGQVLLRPPEQGAEQVDGGQDAQGRPDSPEVDSDPGGEVHARQHVGQLVLPLRPQRGDRLLRGGPRRQLASDHAIE